MDLDELFAEAFRLKPVSFGPHAKMTFPAPKRMSQRTPLGYFYTLPWTAEEVVSYRNIGGWFERGRHDFENREASVAAGLI